jgi:hypothetical protein
MGSTINIRNRPAMEVGMYYGLLGLSVQSFCCLVHSFFFGSTEKIHHRRTTSRLLRYPKARISTWTKAS